jgi:hypothetical protein
VVERASAAEAASQYPRLTRRLSAALPRCRKDRAARCRIKIKVKGGGQECPLHTGRVERNECRDPSTAHADS